MIGLVILNFFGVLMSLKSIFSGDNGILSESPSNSLFLGVERRVTPSFNGERRFGVTFGGVRILEWKVEFLLRSISGDHVAGRCLRPEI